jgi:hypothetical protein
MLVINRLNGKQLSDDANRSPSLHCRTFGHFGGIGSRVADPIPLPDLKKAENSSTSFLCLNQSVYTRESEPILKRDAIIVNRKESLWRLLDEQNRWLEENIITRAKKMAAS